ncbi:MAG: 30S ribosomal protein S6 [Bacteroidia bacterium]
MDIKPKSFQNEYETTFILNPELPEGEHKKAVDKFVNLIRDNGGEVHNIEHWGMRKLAYPIARKTNGYYVFIEFRGNAEFIAKLDQSYRYDDQVIRFLTVKLDKHALAFNRKRREQEFGLRKEATQKTR